MFTKMGEKQWVGSASHSQDCAVGELELAYCVVTSKLEPEPFCMDWNRD